MRQDIMNTIQISKEQADEDALNGLLAYKNATTDLPQFIWRRIFKKYGGKSPTLSMTRNFTTIHLHLKEANKKFILDQVDVSEPYPLKDIKRTLKRRNIKESWERCFNIIDDLMRNNTGWVILPVLTSYKTHDPRDKHISHAMAFLTDNREILIYDPYGSYEKLGINYENVLREFSQLINKQIPFNTFHSKFNSPKTQSIVLAHNTGNISTIEKRISESFDVEFDPIKDTTLFDVMHKCSMCPEASSILGNYMSMICVSIMLLEMIYFIRGETPRIKPLLVGNMTKNILSSLRSEVSALYDDKNFDDLLRL